MGSSSKQKGSGILIVPRDVNLDEVAKAAESLGVPSYTKVRTKLEELQGSLDDRWLGRQGDLITVRFAGNEGEETEFYCNLRTILGLDSRLRGMDTDDQAYPYSPPAERTGWKILAGLLTPLLGGMIISAPNAADAQTGSQRKWLKATTYGINAIPGEILLPPSKVVPGQWDWTAALQTEESRQQVRIFPWEDFVETYHGARESGFGNGADDGIMTDIRGLLQHPELYDFYNRGEDLRALGDSLTIFANNRDSLKAMPLPFIGSLTPDETRKLSDMVRDMGYGRHDKPSHLVVPFYHIAGDPESVLGTWIFSPSPDTIKVPVEPEIPVNKPPEIIFNPEVQWVAYEGQPLNLENAVQVRDDKGPSSQLRLFLIDSGNFRTTYAGGNQKELAKNFSVESIGPLGYDSPRSIVLRFLAVDPEKYSLAQKRLEVVDAAPPSPLIAGQAGLFMGRESRRLSLEPNLVVPIAILDILGRYNLELGLVSGHGSQEGTMPWMYAHLPLIPLGSDDAKDDARFHLAIQAALLHHNIFADIYRRGEDFSAHRETATNYFLSPVVQYGPAGASAMLGENWAKTDIPYSSVHGKGTLQNVLAYITHKGWMAALGAHSQGQGLDDAVQQGHNFHGYLSHGIKSWEIVALSHKQAMGMPDYLDMIVANGWLLGYRNSRIPNETSPDGRTGNLGYNHHEVRAALGLGNIGGYACLTMTEDTEIVTPAYIMNPRGIYVRDPENDRQQVINNPVQWRAGIWGRKGNLTGVIEGVADRYKHLLIGLLYHFGRK